MCYGNSNNFDLPIYHCIQQCRSSYSTQLYHAWTTKERLNVSLWIIRYMYPIGPRNHGYDLQITKTWKLCGWIYQESSDHRNVDQRQVCYTFPTRCINFHVNKSLLRYSVHALFKPHLVKAKTWIMKFKIIKIHFIRLVKSA